MGQFRLIIGVMDRTLLVFLAVAVASCVAQECAYGHQRIGERCYLIHIGGLSWENAQLNCQSYGGGYLAHIEDYAVFEEIGPVLHELNKRTNALVWVGARSQRTVAVGERSSCSYRRC